MSDLDFAADFFKKEKRRNFTIGEPMKRSWAADLVILEDVKSLCEKYSLKVFACYGTLLGAIRDNGFIAWDDDVDLGLVGRDYEVFLEVFEKEYGDKYNILNPYTRHWHHMNFTHISNGKELNFKREHLKKWYGCPFMAGPDIYPYYYIPRNPNDEKFILNMLKKIDDTLLLFKQSNEMAAQKGELKGDDTIIQALTYNLYELQNATGYEFGNERPLDNQLEILYDQICRITEESEADYVCRYDEYTANRTKKFPKDYFTTTIPVSFENTTMPVPIGYDDVLVKRFGGEYIIPRREAAAHDYPFFKKQLGVDFSFNNISLESVCKNSKMNLSELENKDGRKMIMYHTSIRSMIVYSEYVIDKIKSVLDDAKNSKDIRLVWLPDAFPKTEDIALDLVVPDLIEQYENLINEYSGNGGCVIGRENWNVDIIDMFDEYLGDDDDICNKFAVNNKKVTIQDYLEKGIQLDNLEYDILPNEDIDISENIVITDEKSVIPEKWKSKIINADGTRKKTVLYSLSVSKLYQNEKNAVEKIVNCLRSFKENQDEVILLWKSVVFSPDAYKAFDSDVIKNIEKIIDDFKHDGWGIYVDEIYIQQAIDISDAYFGDPDAVTLKMKYLNKPVMLQNYDIV